MKSTENKVKFKYEYFLKIAALGQFPIVEINKNDYTNIAHARETLTAALNIEESYDLALGNFLDLEK